MSKDKSILIPIAIGNTTSSTPQYIRFRGTPEAITRLLDLHGTLLQFQIPDFEHLQVETTDIMLLKPNTVPSNAAQAPAIGNLIFYPELSFESAVQNSVPQEITSIQIDAAGDMVFLGELPNGTPWESAVITPQDLRDLLQTLTNP